MPTACANVRAGQCGHKSMLAVRQLPAKHPVLRIYIGSGCTHSECITTHMQEPIMLQATSPCEIRFQSLFHEGRALSFPCDLHGNVDLEALSAEAIENYFFANIAVGLEYAIPVVWNNTPA